jgi:very-short-patch-repair endonuclease
MDEPSERLFNQKYQKPLRQQLRKNTSPIERLLWARLRGGQLGVKFRRRHGIGPYIVDFYCPAARLVIELDGESHYWQGRQEYDKERDNFIEQQGLRIVHFSNFDVTHNLDGVLMRIQDYLPPCTSRSWL